MYKDLPAYGIAEEVGAALQRDGIVVVTAPPGAGKSTVLPVTILRDLPQGRIVMLEPRRLAARAVASRLACNLGEEVGRTAGYRIRFESRVSAATRIEVVTERILTRMMTDDPTLEGVGCIIFDEFHERSLDTDFALALALECRRQLRDDLRIVIMSATIDADDVCRKLGAPPVSCEGRMFPVNTRYLTTMPGDVCEAVAGAVRAAVRETGGGVLAFLPGEAEIRRTQELLRDLDPLPLYGMMSMEEQRKVLEPSASRKIVLATPIAETSLTIDGVTAVVDSGLCRRMRFNPQTSLSRMETVLISTDMADQRRGRAGRTAPGECWRLWNAATESRMAVSRTPEVLDADLTPMVLDAAAWGTADVLSLPWLTPPPAVAVAAARSTLQTIGALDSDGLVTPEGRRIAALPCHPRISRMLLHSSDGLAADIAAILEDRDPLAPGTEDPDLTLRLLRLRDLRASRRMDGRWMRIDRASDQYRRMASLRRSEDVSPYEAGAVVAAAFPERIARSCGGGRFLLADGDIASVPPSTTLAACDWIAVASLGLREGADGRIFLAAPLDPADVRSLATSRKTIAWDTRKGGVVCSEELRIGRLVLETKILSDVCDEDRRSCIIAAAPKEGLTMFDFSDDVAGLQRRIAFASRFVGGLPDVSTAAVLASCGEWLPVYAPKAFTISDLHKVPLADVIWNMLDYEQKREVDRVAPSHLPVPSGSSIRVEYRQGADAPVVRVRLQECFGLTDTPCVADGRVRVLMELLSPGYKPVQLTSDLRSFWSGAYFEVRGELRRRYPRHFWPDNPLEAPAVRGVRRR